MAVVLDAEDVGAMPDDYVAPVTSVNGQTGIVEYSLGFNCVGELVVIEFNRTTGRRRYIHLIVKDGKIVMDLEGSAE